MDFFESIINNKVLIICITAYLVAQFLKVVIVFAEQKRIDIGRFFGAGGMPSSHAAFVGSMATAVGQIAGYDSIEFAISATFALIVMYDASGVRRAAGEHAKAINMLVNSMYRHDKKGEEEAYKNLRELLGHTPFEVLVGVVLGIAIALLML